MALQAIKMEDYLLWNCKFWDHEGNESIMPINVCI